MNAERPLRRVLMTADTLGGIWTYALELARALAPHGVQVVIATMGEPAREDQRREAATAAVELVESGFRLEWMDEPWDDVQRAGDWLLDVAARCRPDAVHLNGYVHGTLPWPVPVVVAAHSCVLSWWQAVKGEPAPPRWQRYRDAVRAGIHAADHLVAPSVAMLRAIFEHYGARPAASVVPNGRDDRFFVPRAKEEVVLAAGRMWDEAKNVSALATVAEHLPWPVLVAGDTTCPDGRARPTAGVTALGRLSNRELAAWMGRASIYALPARYEPFGLSPVEAALSGCALVLGDIPSLRENWHGRALFVAPDDARALEAALARLIGEPDTRRALARAARERALELTPARMAEGYLGVYRQAAERAARRPAAPPFQEAVTA
jgi:glycogen(starch) synthase